MAVHFGQRPTNNFDRKRWESSAEYKTLLEKVKSFKPNMPVIVAGAQGIVVKTDESTLTVYVRVGRVAPGYNVKSVEHAPKMTPK